MKIETPCDRLKQAISASNTDLATCAHACGISVPWAYDLADYPDEFANNLSMSALVSLASFLHCSPVWLISGKDESKVIVSESDAQKRLHDLFINGSLSTELLAEQTGYDCVDSKGELTPLGEFNFQALVGLSNSLNLDWRAVLRGMTKKSNSE